MEIVSRGLWAAFLGTALAAGAPLPNNASVARSYYVRYSGRDSKGAGISMQGTMTFDGTADSNGTGHYTISAQGVRLVCDFGLCLPSALPVRNSGVHRVQSSGWIVIQAPFDSSGKTHVGGGMSDGATAIVAGSPQTAYDGLSVALPTSTAASAATLAGSYSVASVNENGSALFPITATGRSSLGDVTISGWTYGDKGTPATESTPAPSIP